MDLIHRVIYIYIHYLFLNLMCMHLYIYTPMLYNLDTLGNKSVDIFQESGMCSCFSAHLQKHVACFANLKSLGSRF